MIEEVTIPLAGPPHGKPEAGAQASASARSRSSRFTRWERIGRGGSADVYRVHDGQLGIDLAIKMLRSDRPATEKNKTFMRREVLVSRALRHTAICPVHDVYDGEEGFGVIMDLLEGHDLAEWIRNNRDRLIETFDARLGLLLQIADALTVAHKRIVHRDLKPANIFLRQGRIDEPLILDFGLSLLDEESGTNLRGGTPRYMAPEQHDGLVDVRSDFFSFGVLAYELLTGQHPLGNLPRSGISRQNWLSARITPPSTLTPVIPAALDSLVLRLLDPDPARRPESALVAVRSLHAIMDHRAEGQMRDVNNDKLDTIDVPAGDYTIGSPPNSRHAAEKPMRRISLDGYSLTETPVTNRQYLKFVRDTGATPPPLADDPAFGQLDKPVVMLTWPEAAAFCRWAGGRLPSEAEWEVAARAGSRDSEFPWGDASPDTGRANLDSVIGSTSEVRSYPDGRNEWGFWDMAGNVAEWCRDGFSEQAYRQLRDGASNPCHDDTLDGRRSVRGGGFDSMEHACRCAFRSGADENSRRNDIGFRVAFDGT